VEANSNVIRIGVEALAGKTTRLKALLCVKYNKEEIKNESQEDFCDDDSSGPFGAALGSERVRNRSTTNPS
jgi:hypothetical protein